MNAFRSLLVLVTLLLGVCGSRAENTSVEGAIPLVIATDDLLVPRNRQFIDDWNYLRHAISAAKEMPSDDNIADLNKRIAVYSDDLEKNHAGICKSLEYFSRPTSYDENHAKILAELKQKSESNLTKFKDLMPTLQREMASLRAEYLVEEKRREDREAKFKQTVLAFTKDSKIPDQSVSADNGHVFFVEQVRSKEGRLIIDSRLVTPAELKIKSRDVELHASINGQSLGRVVEAHSNSGDELWGDEKYQAGNVVNYTHSFEVSDLKIPASGTIELVFKTADNFTGAVKISYHEFDFIPDNEAITKNVTGKRGFNPSRPYIRETPHVNEWGDTENPYASFAKPVKSSPKNTKFDPDDFLAKTEPAPILTREDVAALIVGLLALSAFIGLWVWFRSAIRAQKTPNIRKSAAVIVVSIALLALTFPMTEDDGNLHPEFFGKIDHGQVHTEAGIHGFLWLSVVLFVVWWTLWNLNPWLEKRRASAQSGIGRFLCLASSFISCAALLCGTIAAFSLWARA